MPDGTSPDYEFLDCGGYERLERFGEAVVRRPAPQADWPRKLPDSAWNTANLVYTRPAGGEGAWGKGEAPDNWRVAFPPITFALRPTPAGQVGVFPEQLPNWLWLLDTLRRVGRPAKILNCFGYTGASSLFCAATNLDRPRPSDENMAHAGRVCPNNIPSACGVEVAHLDASKSSVKHARENAALSGLADAPVRWLVDDTVAFIRKEHKRGRCYDGIILDPPAFGRGPKGERWSLVRDLDSLLVDAAKILSPTPLFFLLTCHEPALTSEAVAQKLSRLGLPGGKLEHFALTLNSTCGGNALPCGICARWQA